MKTLPGVKVSLMVLSSLVISMCIWQVAMTGGGGTNDKNTLNAIKSDSEGENSKVRILAVLVLSSLPMVTM